MPTIGESKSTRPESCFAGASAAGGDGAQLSPAAEAEQLNEKLSPWVYQIPDFLFEALTMRPENFRKPKLIPET